MKPSSILTRAILPLLLVIASTCSLHAETSYNLPLEITDIALNSRLSRDNGSDGTEITSGYSTTGRSGGSALGTGAVRNNGLDISINLGWYPSAFGNEPVLMRLFFLKPGPLVYSPRASTLILDSARASYLPRMPTTMESRTGSKCCAPMA